DRVVAKVLPAHPHYIGAPLPRIEQQREGKPCARPDRMMSLELLDLALGPGMVTLTLCGRKLAHVAGRVVRSRSDLDRVLHQRPQRAAQCVGGCGCGSASLPAELIAPLKLAADFAQASKAPATQAAYGSDFRTGEHARPPPGCDPVFPPRCRL